MRGRGRGDAQSLAGVRVETHLEQLQAVVVVLPEKALEARVEETHGRGGTGGHRPGIGDRIEDDRGERVGDVLELAVASLSDKDCVLRRADRGRIAVGDVAGAGGDLGRDPRSVECVLRVRYATA